MVSRQSRRHGRPGTRPLLTHSPLRSGLSHGVTFPREIITDCCFLNDGYLLIWFLIKGCAPMKYHFRHGRPATGLVIAYPLPSGLLHGVLFFRAPLHTACGTFPFYKCLWRISRKRNRFSLKMFFASFLLQKWF